MTRRRDERGAVLVEFAIVGPVLFIALIAFFEIGMLVIGSAAGTNAAREGARVGIVDFVDADDTTSTTFAAIESAARSKLAGLVADDVNVDVTVRCLDYDDVQAGAADPSIDCTEAAVDVGRDLFEVSVRWRPVIIADFVSPATRTDRARMTILGSPNTSSGGGSPTLATVSLACSPTSLTESNSTQTVTCTVSRTTTSGAVTVNYSTSDGTAVAPGDYTLTNGAVSFAAGGASSSTFTIPIIGDTADEPDETLTVSLSAPTNALLGASTTSITIIDEDPADSTPPALSSVGLYDLVGSLGYFDTVRLQFNEALVACSGHTLGSGVTVAGIPSGYGLSGATVSGSVLSLNFSQGATAVTSVGSLTVSYNAALQGLCDAAGNTVAAFGPVAPVDRASPYLVAISTTNSGAALRPTTGDAIRFQFTEPVLAPAATGTVVLSRGNGNNKETSIAVTPLFAAGDLSPNSFNWFGGNNGGSATFASTLSSSGNDLVVTLGACTGSCSFSGSSPSSITLPPFGWASAPSDAAGNVGSNAVAPPAASVPLTVASMF